MDARPDNLTRPPAPTDTRAGFAARIRRCWGAALENIVDAGQLLVDAKAALPHGAFGALIAEDLPFDARWAQMLMRVALNDNVRNAKWTSHLPASASTLYMLTRLESDRWEPAIAAGEIRPDMREADAARLVAAQNHAARLERIERLAAAEENADAVRAMLAAGEDGEPPPPPPSPVEGEGEDAGEAAAEPPLPGRRWAVIYADPPWENAVWSAETGHGKSPERHYPTMPVADIKALKIGGAPVLTLAAEDCALFLWTTSNRLDLGIDVLRAWGFAFKASFAWGKTHADGTRRRGTGRWSRDCHELLLLGTRGRPPAPLPGAQWDSLQDWPHPGVHSRKPAEWRAMIDAYFPGVRKLELFARREAFRDPATGAIAVPEGWDLWGNEAGEGPAAGVKGRG